MRRQVLGPQSQSRRTFFRDLNSSSWSICWSVDMLKSSALLFSECGTGIVRVFGRVKPCDFGDCFPWAIDGSHTGDSGTGRSSPRPFSRSVPGMAAGRADYAELRCMRAPCLHDTQEAPRWIKATSQRSTISCSVYVLLQLRLLSGMATGACCSTLSDA